MAFEKICHISSKRAFFIAHNNVRHVDRHFFIAFSSNYRVISLTSLIESKRAFGTRRNIFMAVSPEAGGFSESFVDGIAGSESTGQQSSLWGARA